MWSVNRSADMDDGLDQIRVAPGQLGTLELIVCRPAIDSREVLEIGVIDVSEGLAGDSWKARGNSRSADGSADADAQLTLMNARAAAVIAGPIDRWPLAGDQLFVDFDLSETGTPAGTRLRIG